MGSHYAAPPQSVPVDTQHQRSRPTRLGFVGIKEGTVASRIQACNERESRAEAAAPAKETRARETHQESSFGPGPSSQTALKRIESRPDKSAAFVRSDEPHDALHGRSHSGEGEEQKVWDYTGGDEGRLKRNQEWPSETRPLRRVASQHSVQYSKPTPTTYTTERDKSGSYVMVGAKQRSNVEATSPYAIVRPQESKSSSTISVYGQKSRDLVEASHSGGWQGDRNALHHVDNTEGAFKTFLRPPMQKSLIPVFRKKPEPMVREENISHSPQHTACPTFRKEANERFGEEISRIIDMLDIMSADHVQQIRRIAHHMSPKRVSTRLSWHQEDLPGRVLLHDGSQTPPERQFVSNEPPSTDLHALIKIIEVSADSWTDSQTRKIVEMSTSDSLQREFSAQATTKDAPSPLFAAPVKNRNDTTAETTKPNYLVLTAESSPSVLSAPNKDRRKPERMNSNTKLKTVTFQGQPLTWTPLRLN